MKDSHGQTAFSVALWAGLHHLAKLLMLGGANIDDSDASGHTLLHQSLLKQDTPSCIFLLENRANASKR